MKSSQRGDFACAQSGDVTFTSAAGLTLSRQSGHVSGHWYRTWGKRAFDIICVLLAAPVVFPVVLICALMLRRDGGSAFYRQDRLGKNGQRFSILKLRSMVPDAETVLKAYLAENPDQKAEWDVYQKLSHDPRVTRLGRILRATSLDELPQLWNVLRGDMSLVGPRPMLPEQADLHGEFGAYCAHLPGVTGLWQVSDRNDCSFSQRAIYDLQYHETIGLGSDLRLILRTVGVVLRRTGR